MQHLGLRPRRRHRARQNRPARQSIAAGRQPDPPRRRARHDRHDLRRTAGLRLRPRRRHRAARHRRQPGLQPRALRGGPRPDRRGLDPTGTLPLGRPPLPAPRRQPLGPAHAAAPPAHLDPRRALPRDRHLGSQAPLPIHRPQHHHRSHQAHLEHLRRRRPRGGLRSRPRKPRLPTSRPRRRHHREGDGERIAVHVDAGRVHRPGTPGLVQPRRLRLTAQPRSPGRGHERTPASAARAVLRQPDRKHADHRRHPR